jgi:hypothetical protein
MPPSSNQNRRKIMMDDKNWRTRSTSMTVFYISFILYILYASLNGWGVFIGNKERLAALLNMRDASFWGIVLCNVLFFYTWHNINNLDKNKTDNLNLNINSLKKEKVFFRNMNIAFGILFLCFLFSIKLTFSKG